MVTFLQRSRWPRGRVLGGSSVLNYMLYVRGNKKDYDNWERMGAKGWSWKDVFPYFLKSEDNRDASLVDEGKYVRLHMIKYDLQATKVISLQCRDNWDIILE